MHTRILSCTLLQQILLFTLLFPVHAAETPPAAPSDNSQPAVPEDPKPEPENSDRYEFRKQHDPNGIGKFYMDREIAHVMGAAGIPWLERPQREDEESLSRLIDALDLKQGDHIADVGAGSGVLTFRMAERIGPTGLAWALDVQPEMLEALESRMKEREVSNIKPLLSTERETRLPPESIDLALMVDVYHEFAFPYEMLLDLSQKIKPGGRIVLVEYRKEDPDVPIKLVHKMTEAQVKRELSLPELHLQWKATIPTLPRQHIIVFEKIPPKNGTP